MFSWFTGTGEVAPYFAQSVAALGFQTHAPQYTEAYDLIADKVLEVGYLPERKARTAAGKTSSAYERLVAVGNLLMESIKRSKGGTTSPWPGLPTSFASFWRSGRAKGSLPEPGQRETWPPAPTPAGHKARPGSCSAWAGGLPAGLGGAGRSS